MHSDAAVKVPIVYVAGPYRAHCPMQVKRNIREAEEIGRQVMDAGAFPIIPHANTAFMDEAYSDATFLTGTMALLLRCDAVVFSPRWRTSEGSKGEFRCAMERNIRGFHWESPLDRAGFDAWVTEFRAARVERVTA